MKVSEIEQGILKPVSGKLVQKCMSSFQPKTQAVKKAVEWISQQRKESPGKFLHEIIDEAVFRFDLSPGDTEFLNRFFQERHHI